MIRRAQGLAIFLALFGLAVLLLGRANITPHDEKWLEQTYPSHVGDYQMVGSADNPQQSYKMDETTYLELKPMGIVSRVLTNGRHSFDVVVISSHERDSFHNPLACFAAQEWKVSNPHVTHLQTKLRGDVEVSVVTAEKGGHPSIAVYTYEGPTAMHGINTEMMGLKGLHGDLFWTELKTARPQFATFFRFVCSDSGVTEEEVLEFAALYLDSAPVRPVKI